MYLYGSLASGDFDPERSDIDFVVVTTDTLSDELRAALEAMHARLQTSDSKWATKLEGAYISRRAIRRYDPNEALCPYINEGKFRVGRLGSDWIIQRHRLETRRGALGIGRAWRAMVGVDRMGAGMARRYASG